MSNATRRQLPVSDELAVWRAYVETFDAVRARVESRLQQDTQLSTGDYKVLLALSEADGKALRSSELAARIEWERSRLSGQLGRMDKRGLVRRESCEEDARGSRVVLSDEGERAFRTSTVPHFRAIKELFVDAFTPQQLAQLSEITTTMRHHLGLDDRQ
ncbi:MAG: MarR family transcriptional regulator [Rhodococcus sp. (in: high G+C Gram-positive bacteria)]